MKTHLGISWERNVQVLIMETNKPIECLECILESVLINEGSKMGFEAEERIEQMLIKHRVKAQ